MRGEFAVAVSLPGLFVDAWFTDIFIFTSAIFGLLCIFFELHVLPGNGFSAVLGTCALFAAFMLAFGTQPFFTLLESLGLALSLSICASYLMLNVWPKKTFFHRLTFTDAQDARYTAGSDYGRLLGRVGQAVSSLRPAGVADIAGERADVLTEGDFVEAGTPVRVSRVEGRRIFVKPLSKENA